jgi:hypothetical protein
LELLEAAAQQWERTEHELAAKSWDEHEALRQRISRSAHKTMEDILVTECGSLMESEIEEGVATQTIHQAIAALTQLANLVDAAGSALNSYPREGFESSGVEPLATEVAIQDLENYLRLSESPTKAELPLQSEELV